MSSGGLEERKVMHFNDDKNKYFLGNGSIFYSFSQGLIQRVVPLPIPSIQLQFHPTSTK